MKHTSLEEGLQYGRFRGEAIIRRQSSKLEACPVYKANGLSTGKYKTEKPMGFENYYFISDPERGNSSYLNKIHH